jgi:hypothetical protein
MNNKHKNTRAMRNALANDHHHDDLEGEFFYHHDLVIASSNLLGC